MNAGKGELQALKTNLLENTMTVRFRKQLIMQFSKCRTLLYHSSYRTFVAIGEAYMHLSIWK